MKTLTLKKPEPAAGAAPDGAAAASVNPAQEGIYVSSRLRNPLEGAGAVKRENWTWAAILAAITAVLFAAIVALQFMDSSALSLA